MRKIDYSCPLPVKKLVERYGPAFKILSSGRSSTIVSIPHLGHTSHMRFINSSKNIQRKLGSKNELFLFIDRDRIVNGYESFLSEMLIGLNPKNINLPQFQSQNAYLLMQEIINQTQKITANKQVMISLVVEGKILNFLSEIENLFLILQKSTNNKVSVLWITDSKISREHKATHPSSTFLTNILYQKNFNLEETQYCLTRIADLKGLKLNEIIMKNALEFTGGFACTFHQFINTGEILKSEYVKSSLFEIKKEVELKSDLVTDEGLIFLKKIDISEIEFESIKLKSNPTSQEINLIRFLQKNIEKPISRDEIAEVLWGKSWNTKYSDWAIDKAISRLRKNIISENYKIITVKNLGYELIKL